MWNVQWVDDDSKIRYKTRCVCARLGHSDTLMLHGIDDVKPSRVNTRPTHDHASTVPRQESPTGALFNVFDGEVAGRRSCR